MTASIVDLEQKCESQDLEIQTLREENLRLCKQTEAIAILKAQVCDTLNY